MRETEGGGENKERTEGKQEREQQFIIDYIHNVPSKKYAYISAVRKQLACSSGTVTMSLFVAF